MKQRLLTPLLLLPSLLLVAPSAIAGDTVPTEVAERFKSAVMLNEIEDFVGTYTVTTETMVQKPNGKSRQEEIMVVAVSCAPGGSTHRRLVRLIENGKDVTEKRRKKVEKELAEDDGRAEEEGEDEDLVDPFGTGSGKYVFSDFKNDGDAVLLSFEPKAEYRQEEGMAEGTIVWHRETLDPISIHMTAVTPPGPLKDLDLRMEFARVGDAIYMSGLVSKGLAKVLLFTREFEADIRVSDVKTNPPTTN